MGKEVTLFEAEEKRSLSEVADFFRQLADRLDKKKVVLRAGDKKIKLDIPDNVELEIEVEKEISKNKTEIELEIELKWIEGDKRDGKSKRGPISLD